MTSLLGHSCLVALCFLAFSQVGHAGLIFLQERHQVACECRCGRPGGQLEHGCVRSSFEGWWPQYSV